MAEDSDAAKLFLTRNPALLSARERLEALQAINNVVERLDPKSIKIVLLQLIKGLLIYRDKKSSSALLDVLKKVFRCHGVEAGNIFVGMLGGVSRDLLTGALSVHSAIALLQWCEVGVEANAISPDELTWSSFVTWVSEAHWFVVGRGNKRQQSAADKVVASICSHGYSAKFLDVLVAKEPKPEYLVLASLLLGFPDGDELAEQYKDKMLAMFVSVVIATKIRLPEYVVPRCQVVLDAMSPEHLVDTVLPAVKRALLRNPETALPSVAQMFRCISLNLDCISTEAGKTLYSCVDSTHPTQRSNGIEAFSSLALKCAEGKSLEGLVSLSKDKLKEGKKMATDQRTAVVTMYGSLSGCPAITAAIATAASDDICKAMDSEINELVLVALVKTVYLFQTKGCVGGVPLALQLKKLLSNKGTTMATRLEVYRCLYDGEWEGEGLAELEAVLEQQLRKPIPATLVEAILAGLTVYRHVDGALAPLKEALCRLVASDVMCSDKAVSLLSPAVHLPCCRLGAAVLSGIVPGNRDAWALHCAQLLASPDWSVRRQCRLALAHALTSEKAAMFLVLDKMADLLNKDLEVVQKVEETGKKSLGAYFKEVMFWLSSLEVTWKEELALAMFASATHTLVDSTHSGLWATVVRRMGVALPTLVADHAPSLVSSSWACRPHTSSIRLLLATNPSTITPLVVAKLRAVLGREEVVKATQEEVDILATPPDQLQDTSLYEDLLSSLASGQAEQKGSSSGRSRDLEWDARVRAEQGQRKLQLLRGRPVREVLAAPGVGSRCRDAAATRLDWEETVRSRMAEMEKDVVWAVSCLRVVMETISDLQLLGLPDLLSTLMSGLSSPLLHPHLCSVWAETTATAFGGASQTGDLLGWLTVQLLHPIAEPVQRWKWSGRTWPKGGVARAAAMVLDRVLAEQLSSVYWFCPTLPFLSHALHSPPPKWTTPQLVAKAINVIHRASLALRECPADDAASFPVAETLYLVIQLMMSHDISALPVKTQKMISEIHFQLCEGIADIGPTPSILQVMIEGLYSINPKIRLTSLSGLQQFVSHLRSDGEELVAWILICRHDSNQDVSSVASKLWDNVGMTLSSGLGPTLITVLTGSLTHMHVPAAKALATVLQSHPDQGQSMLHALVAEYHQLYKDLTPIKNDVGRIVGEPLLDPWESRVGVSRGLEHLAPYVSSEVAKEAIQFLVSQGAGPQRGDIKGLGDRHCDVRAGMLSACLALLASHEQQLSEQTMRLCEDCLLTAGNSSQADLLRQSIVVVMGTLAKNLSKEDPRVKSIVLQLLGYLDTPSQQVQEAIGACLPALVPAMREEAGQLLAPLLEKLLEGKSYALRKGAAYGVAGVVKGLGIPSLKQHGVMQAVQIAVGNKKNFKHREGALLAIEQLTTALGRLFEPYVVKLLPNLLSCYGDGNQYVREATVDASRAIMSRLSGHGVKLVLPDLLKGLEEDSWRTKAGSAELLGAMAHCAPKQLSSCLPTIVPPLGLVLNDSHVKVQEAARQALTEISSVIKNPEIQAMSPVLLQGLADPSAHTNGCLQALLDTRFVHLIDAPSLALIMPVLQQALELRSSEGKKMAAQILGNMYQLTDPKDLAPYLPSVLPGLKGALVDPVPEVRTHASVALGAMVRAMGEGPVAELLAWLFSTLQSELSAVDRSGAAQGLSELIRAQGPEHLAAMMPKFVAAVMNNTALPQVRDGYLMLFIYIPVAMGDHFLSYVAPVIPCILQGLADESEFVRDTALRAGQGMVQRYSDMALELFLPQLEQGLSDANWRIRYSSIQLLGDLLYCISGLSGKMSTMSKEDDNFGTESAKQQIIDKLGYERRNRVFAGLYMGRSDVALLVRQISLHVWKVVVVNTPRTLREILPQTLNLVLASLVSEVHDRRQVAARTVGDLVRKLGDRVLPEVIPIMQARLEGGSDQEREGVCIGLSEIVKCTDPEAVEEYTSSILSPIRHALLDSAPHVRAAAAETFSSLHSSLGNKVLDEVVPFVLDALNDEERYEVALDALQQLLRFRSRQLLFYLVPKLVTPPVNSRALAVLSSVAGESLQHHLKKIIPALLSAANAHINEPDHQSWRAAESLVLSLYDPLCLTELISHLLTAAKDMTISMRQTALKLLLLLCSQGGEGLEDHTHNLLSFLILCLEDRDGPCADHAWDALAAIIKKQDPKELPDFISSVHSSTKRLVAGLQGAELHGFTRKGVEPILVVLKETLFKGTQDEREEAALTMLDLVQLCSVPVLTTKNNVIQIAGPLIRLVGDRFGPNVKMATLNALIALIAKVGLAAKSIFPQLQTSYIKALCEGHGGVRDRARRGLVALVPYTLRIDPVYNEIHKGIKNNEEAAVRNSLLLTLEEVAVARPGSASAKFLGDILPTLRSLLQGNEESTRVQAGSALGVLSLHLPEAELAALLQSVLDHAPSMDAGAAPGGLWVATRVLEGGVDRLERLGLVQLILQAVMTTLSSGNVAVLSASLICACRAFVHLPDSRASLTPHVVKAFSHDLFDTRLAACEGCAYLAQKTTPPDVDQFVASIVAVLMDASRERNSAVKAAASEALSQFSVECLQLCKKWIPVIQAARLQELISRQ